MRRLFSLILVASVLTATLAGAQTSESIPDGLWAGRIGSLEIGMKQREVESLLQHRIELDRFQDFPSVMDLRARDLESLGIDRIAGIPSFTADLQFDNPLNGERQLRDVRIGIRCDKWRELGRRLGLEDQASGDAPDYDPSKNPKYNWGVAGPPGCHLWLRLNTDRLN